MLLAKEGFRLRFVIPSGADRWDMELMDLVCNFNYCSTLHIFIGLDVCLPVLHYFRMLRGKAHLAGETKQTIPNPTIGDPRFKMIYVSYLILSILKGCCLTVVQALTGPVQYTKFMSRPNVCPVPTYVPSQPMYRAGICTVLTFLPSRRM